MHATKYILIVFLSLGYNWCFSQTSPFYCHPGNPNAIQEVVRNKVYTNVTMPQTDSVKGYLEHLPADYNANNLNKKHPLVLVLHVFNEFGDGSASAMCKFFALKWQLFPYIRIENGNWPTTLPLGNGQNTTFITLTPQFVNANYTDVTVDAFIEYAKQTYNIDDSKIYLLGTSQGANVALQYIGNDESRSRKIAGVLALSPCYNLNDSQVQNIKKSGVNLWSFQCSTDKGCINRENDTIAAYNNYNKLKAVGIDDDKNVLSHLTPGNGCNNNPHDTWTPTLNNNFRMSTLSTPKNVYEWMGPLTNNVILPVVLRNFNATKKNNQVWLQWQTTTEENSDQFYIQRAGDDLIFYTIDSVASKNFPTGSMYQFTDVNPQQGNNFYRLLQKDRDGLIQTFETKKVSFNTNVSVIISSNPIRDQLQFSIYSNTTDRYQIFIRDINGRILLQENTTLSKGNTTFRKETSHWPNGMYLLTVQSNNETLSYKIIK